MKIVIKEQEIELKYSFRSLMVYEQILGKTFEPKGLTEILTFMYCIIITSKKDLQFTYDEFLDLIDEKPGIIKDFSEWLTGAVQRNASMMSQNVKEEDKQTAKKIKKTEKN